MSTQRDREVFTLLRAIYGRKASEVAARSGVSAQTIANWRKPLSEGGTRHPRFHTMKKVAKAAGMEFRLVEIETKPVARTRKTASKVLISSEVIAH